MELATTINGVGIDQNVIMVIVSIKVRGDDCLIFIPAELFGKFNSEVMYFLRGHIFSLVGENDVIGLICLVPIIKPLIMTEMIELFR